MEHIAGKVLVVEGVLFDPNGVTGLWDLLHEHVGVRNTPKINATPWSLFLKPGVLVLAHPDGRLKVSTTTARVCDVQAVELILCQKFAAAWSSASAHSDGAKHAKTKISYGKMGYTARDMSEPSGFRKAHSSVHF